MKSMLFAAAILSASALVAAEPFVLEVKDGKMSIVNAKNNDYGTLKVVDDGLLVENDKTPSREYNTIGVDFDKVISPGAPVEAEFDLKVVRFTEGKPGAFHVNAALLENGGGRCWNCLMRIDRNQIFSYAGNWKFPANFSPLERHTYKLTLNPADGKVAISVDGVERITGKATHYSKPQPFVWFGDGTKRDSAGAVIIYKAEVR